MVKREKKEVSRQETGLRCQGCNAVYLLLRCAFVNLYDVVHDTRTSAVENMRKCCLQAPHRLRKIFRSFPLRLDAHHRYWVID
jgi:hypothetical protein